MAEIVKKMRIDWDATFSPLEVGGSIDIKLKGVTDSSVRMAASRFSKRKKVVLKPELSADATSIKVTRMS